MQTNNEQLQKVEKAFSEFGISIKNLGDSFKAASEIMFKLSSAWDKGSPRKERKVSKALAGKNPLCFINRIRKWATLVVLRWKSFRDR